MRRIFHSLFITLLLVLPLAGCQSIASQPSPSLYQQLGERAGISKLVTDLLYIIVDDSRINFQFKGVDVAGFHRKFTNQLCQLSGGPCLYKGRTMRDVHAAMHITDTQFNALVEDLILAMEKNHLATATQNQLLALLVPMYPDVRTLVD